MVLVVVTKGQQEALILLAPVQKQCTGMRALNKCSADFSVPDSWRWSLKIPAYPSQADVPGEPSVLAKCPPLYLVSHA